MQMTAMKLWSGNRVVASSATTAGWRRGARPKLSLPLRPGGTSGWTGCWRPFQMKSV